MNTSNLIKQITFKRVLLFLGGLIGLAVLGVGCFALYIIIPSGLQSSFAKGPEVLTELMAMAEESQPYNPDPYIASTYRPDNPLYEPVLNIQRKRWDLAEKQLQPLVKQNNADAMFWLAHITYATGFYSSGSAAKLFQRAAKLGNPYAALRLDADNYECQGHMGHFCDKKWGVLGRKLLEERAEKGDLKAAFYRVVIDIHSRSSSAEEWQQVVRLVAENARNNNYQPLRWLLEKYYSRMYYPFLKKKEPLSSKQKESLVKLAMLASNNNFTPAMIEFTYLLRNFLPEKYSSNQSYVPELVEHLMKLNLNDFVYRDYFLNKSQSRSYVVLGAAYAYAEDIVKNKVGKHGDYFGLYLFMLDEKQIKTLTDAEINKAKYMAKRLVKNMTPIIYIDEMTQTINYW